MTEVWPEPQDVPEVEPLPFPEIRSWKCPGCLVTCYEGVIDGSFHWPFCSVMHPPWPPPDYGGLIGGIVT